MKTQNTSHSKENLDPLAQRCRDLEACIAGDHTNLVALLRVGQAKAERERDTLRAEVERLRQSLRSVIVAAGGSAAPDVSAEFLELAPLEVLALRGNLDQLQARLRRIESIAECGSVQSWLALPDEAKAKWFGLHAEQDGERLRLRAEVETLREIREIASQCAANGGYLCSRDLIELRALLRGGEA